MTEENNSLKVIEVPPTLSQDMVKFAQQFVRLRLQGMAIANICSELSISTKTYYKWNEFDDFKWYVKELESLTISDDERIAYASVKKYILKKVQEENPSDKHVDMFFKYFEYVVDAENEKRMRELNIESSAKGSSFISVEERKANLLSRLLPNK